MGSTNIEHSMHATTLLGKLFVGFFNSLSVSVSVGRSVCLSACVYVCARARVHMRVCMLKSYNASKVCSVMMINEYIGFRSSI